MDEEKIEEIKLDSNKKENDVLDLANQVAERLEAKKQELLQIEAQIDKKTQDFKKFIENTTIQGMSMAGQQPLTQQQQDDIQLKKIFDTVGVKLPF